MNSLALVSLLLGLALWALARAPLPALQGSGLEGLAVSLVALTSMGLGMTLLALRLAHVSARQKAALAEAAQDRRALDAVREALDAHTLVTISDPNGVLLDVNENYARLLECRAEDLIGKSARIFYAPDQPEMSFDEVQRSLSRGRSWKGIQYLQTRSGRRIVAQATIIPELDAAGRHVRTVSVRTDITHREARVARRSRAEIVDMLNDSVLVLDPEGHVLHVNRPARRQFGIDIDAISLCTRNCPAAGPACRCSLESLLGTEFAAQVSRRLAGLDERPAQQASFEIELPQGDFEVTLNLHQGRGAERSVVVLLHDISARRATERERLQHVTMISHELRTPLTSIKGALDMLGSGALGPLEGGQANLVGIARRNSERLLLIVNDILDFEKLDAGMMPFEIAPVPLARLLEDAVSVNQGFAEAHNTRFELSPVPAAAQVQADAHRLLQVLTNLMSNAAKYSPEGVPVTIATEEAGAMWRITVQDRGPGIPPEARATIFDCFTRAGRERDGRQREGTGLGLAISKRIVERLGGEIGFETSIAVGHGTRFHVSLPKAEGDSPAVDAA